MYGNGAAHQMYRMISRQVSVNQDSVRFDWAKRPIRAFFIFLVHLIDTIYGPIKVSKTQIFK